MTDRRRRELTADEIRQRTEAGRKASRTTVAQRAFGLADYIHATQGITRKGVHDGEPLILVLNGVPQCDAGRLLLAQEARRRRGA